MMDAEPRKEQPMSERELWVARSHDCGPTLSLFFSEPVEATVMGLVGWYGDDEVFLDASMFPELPPGQKRRVRLELEAE